MLSMKRMGAKNVGVIVEDPSNGEILAMDGGDRYDLNESQRSFPALYQGRDQRNE